MTKNLKNLKNFMQIQSYDMQQDEFITIAITYRNSNGYQKFKYMSFKSLEETIACAQKYIASKCEVFFVLGLTDGKGQKVTNMKSTNFIALDFDFKDKPMPTAKELTSKLKKKLGVYITALVNSGHGYHVYIQIEKTNDIKSFNKLTKRLQQFLGADCQATRPNQILRFPTSINYKNADEPKSCSLIYCNPGNPYSLAKLNKIIDGYEINKEYSDYTKIRPCVTKMMKGVDEGYRNFALSCIVLEQKRINISHDKAIKSVLDFNKNCNPPESEEVIIEKFENLWNSKTYTFCGCNHKDPTKNSMVKKFCQGECIFKINYANFEKSTELGIPSNYIKPIMLNQLNGAEISLLIYIYQNSKVTINDLKSYFSYNTLKKYLNALIKLKLINIIDGYITLTKINDQTLTIDGRVPTLCLNKKLSKNATKVYYAIIWLNAIKSKTSIQNIANTLNMSKCNVSSLVNELNECGLIHAYQHYVGAGYYYKIVA